MRPFTWKKDDATYKPLISPFIANSGWIGAANFANDELSAFLAVFTKEALEYTLRETNRYASEEILFSNHITR